MMKIRRSWFALGVAMVLGACSDGSLKGDGGAGAGGGGGSGATGAVGGSAGSGATGQVGAGGTAGSDAGTAGGGAAGQAGTGGVAGSGDGAGRGGGTGGLPCVETTTCTPSDVGTARAGQSCAMEGAFCDEASCTIGGQQFNSTLLCCAGKWWDRSYGLRTCPTQPNPGDPFLCPSSDGSTVSCTAGQTYCAYPPGGGAPSCKPLCTAGDCTCFCGQAGRCDFDPPDKVCPGDRCSCSQVGGADVALNGAFFVSCHYSPQTPGQCDFDPSADQSCAAAGLSGRALGCTGPRMASNGNCVALPDSYVTLTCGGTELHYWCCPG